MQRQTVLSRCGNYRFVLTRSDNPLFPSKGTVLFALNNPSTADHKIDDRTSTRGWNYTQQWGYYRMVFVNANPFRSTKPSLAIIPNEEVLAKNDMYVYHQAYEADLIVCAWGTYTNEALSRRLEQVLRKAASETGKRVHVLALTQGGIPKHPLYLKGDLQPQIWNRT